MQQHHTGTQRRFLNVASGLCESEPGAEKITNMGKTTIYKDVEVDIDLDEFDNEDILDRAEEIIKKAELGKPGYDKKLSIAFRNAIHSPSFTPKISKVDEWKDELWPLIKAKFSLEELEALIK